MLHEKLPQGPAEPCNIEPSDWGRSQQKVSSSFRKLARKTLTVPLVSFRQHMCKPQWVALPWKRQEKFREKFRQRQNTLPQNKNSSAESYIGEQPEHSRILRGHLWCAQMWRSLLASSVSHLNKKHALFTKSDFHWNGCVSVMWMSCMLRRETPHLLLCWFLPWHVWPFAPLAEDSIHWKARGLCRKQKEMADFAWSYICPCEVRRPQNCKALSSSIPNYFLDKHLRSYSGADLEVSACVFKALAEAESQ